ncbi:uncharacterized protein LOC122282202 [Carya illinoinensis]|uniref:uncharacterized protein LOC122282202 n=1 Tax=Carya illinoinensis TaxID=32201 RepID=UPI001C71E90F|nr:uncharacterized protein LOC122282202 [Carya illinoinensis]
MKILSWNLRGLGNPRSIRSLHDLLTSEVPEILFLQETKLSSRRLEFCKLRLGFRCCFGVDSVGRSGGLALFWKEDINLRIISYSRIHIHASIKNCDGVEWLLTGVYGHPDSGQGSEGWRLLKFLGRGVVLPWIVFGDFNEILDHSEKLGGNIRSDLQMREFREVLSDCHLRDLGYVGSLFTWSNRRGEEDLVKERLDRFLANSLWCDMFPNLRVTHGVVAYSDHIPLWLDTEGALFRRRSRRLFRFEAMWVGETECSSIIERVWGRRHGPISLDQIMGRFSSCATELGRWNKASFGHVQKNLATAKRRLQCLEENDSGPHRLEEHKQACLEVQKWLERDELMWKQRSRGDQMDVLITEYFQTLFTATDRVDMEDVLSGVEARVTAEMNEELLKPYAAEEVEVALKQMHPSRAPGPDGMPPLFFQKYWGMLGNSITNALLSALNSGMFPSGLNHTFITLIPKKASPSKVADFRPISLCNVLYKILSKVIANRLKRVLPYIISNSQRAFVPGRQISDNVLIAYELLHFLRNKRKGRKGFMSLKLDMSKAYDRCVRTVSFSVLVNGSPKGPIIPSRGLRQGDPLSPYLFLLCTEDLISLLKRNASREGVDGIRICRSAPRINHLLFADDSVIFCKADVITNVKIQSFLNKYERASGQCINKEKTSMVFSKNVNDNLKRDIMQLWGGSFTQQYEKYLGLPPMVGRSKKQAFSDIKKRVWQKLQVWKGNLLSQGGREVLIKAVAIWEKLCVSKFQGGMSFRDLHLFNLALLAKQGWRLLRNVDSLLYKVYKAKYFPNSCLFEAKVGANSSYVWKGIWEALDCLRKGCRWRLGNGQTVRIFKDLWLPECPSVSTLVEVDENLKVNSLIDDSTGWWNVHMVRALFNPNLVQQILKLQVSIDAEDSLYWSHEKNGSFSVRSAYRYLQHNQHLSNGQSSTGRYEAMFWKSLWHLKLPKKMKVFAWRACQEKLPTFLNLKKKHVLDDATCGLCNQGMEDAAHALFFCSEVRSVWGVFCSQMDNMQPDLSFWDLANLAHVQLFDVSNQKITQVVRWHPPPNDFLKLNIDGATFPEHSVARIGVVLRDQYGEVIVACSKVEKEVSSAEFIEAVALLLCTQWGVPKITLETDCLVLVNALNENSVCLTDFAFILQDIRRLMVGFQEVKVVHVNRLGNLVAHCLARHAWLIDDICMWWDYCPSFVSQALWLDKLAICKDN